MSLRDSRIKLSTSQGPDSESIKLRSENDDLRNQIVSLQADLRKRETSVYELVNRSHDLAAKLNDKTTENNRINKKLLSTVTAHAELKSRFIESLKKLKSCRTMLKLSFEKNYRYGSSIEGILMSFQSGQSFNFDKLQSIFKKLKNNDFKFSMGSQDYSEALNLLERGELKNFENLKEIYLDTLKQIKFVSAGLYPLSNEKLDHSQSLHHPRLESSMNTSLIHNFNNFDKNLSSISGMHTCSCNQNLQKIPSIKPALNENGLLSIDENDDPSIESNGNGTLVKRKSMIGSITNVNGNILNGKPADQSFHFIGSTTAEMHKPSVNGQNWDQTPILKPQVQNYLGQLQDFKKQLKQPNLSFRFLKEKSILTQIFIYEYGF
jgi:hypothetical protein